MTTLRAGALAAALTLGAHGANAQDLGDAEFQFPLTTGTHTVYIPVDCDALDENGEMTPEFVKKMGIWGHLEHVDQRINHHEQTTGQEVSDERRMQLYKDHLQAHGLSPEKIEKAAQHCRENYGAEP